MLTKLPSRFFAFLIVTMVLSSCEFQCSIGDKGKANKTSAAQEDKSATVLKDGAAIYNNIDLKADKIKIKKAFLVFDSTLVRVPDDNLVDFKQPVKLVIIVDSGWAVNEGKVLLGASEKVIAENGNTLLDQPDLFTAYQDGVSETDAKTISLDVILHVKEGSPPTSFTIYFKVWDKKGDGTIEGSYKLFSK